MAIVYAGFGVWGIASAIGLWRLRNWARICFAVFGGLLCVSSLCGAFGFIVAMFVLPQAMPPGNTVPTENVTAVLAVFTVFALLCAQQKLDATGSGFAARNLSRARSPPLFRIEGSGGVR
jgi:nitrate reductase NapE component